jgi:4-hydroxybenzoate polyprenyltransferase/phosphoserine phosphatase
MSQDNTLVPLFVDLDGTLIETDLLYEGVLKAIKTSVWSIFLMPCWLLKGKAYFKERLAKVAAPDFTVLPYNELFLDFLIKEKQSGRQLYLATASHQDYAEKVAEHLGIFDGVLATGNDNNLKGEVKANACKEISEIFAYAGNAVEDYEIFKESTESYLVHPDKKALRLSHGQSFNEVWYREIPSVKVWLKALRVHQWLKNILLFVPLFVAGQYTESESIFLVFLGFLTFSLLASATYLINDLLDLDADRNHPRKKLRALASGQIRIIECVKALCALSLGIVFFALFTPVGFQFSLFGYLVFTLIYSFFLKHYVIADVIALASLFTVRIIAGALILDLTPSFWLLAFSMFTFFSLALVKRCAEIKMLEENQQYQSSGRDYNVDDYNLMQSLGITSAFMSILLMAFYVQEAYVGDVYSTPVMLWLTLPAFAYWLCRMWLKTSRSEMHDDPIVFSIKDKGSVITIAFICIITVLAKL